LNGTLAKEVKRNIICADTCSTKLRDRNFSTKCVIKAVIFVANEH